MKMELVGEVTPGMTIGTVLDLVILLPLALYFFVFKRKISFLMVLPISIIGLLLANWIIPAYADHYLHTINQAVIVGEVLFISLELLLLIFLLKRIPALKRKTRAFKQSYHFFLRSFIEASQEVFSFRYKKLNQYQHFLRFLSTDLAVFYYVFFSWRKQTKPLSNAFTYHRNAEYQGVFFLIVHALAIEVIAVHVIALQFSHILAWILTTLDVYALLFVIADYQAIRITPVILDEKGVHVQKGLRFHAFIPYEKISGITKNEKTSKVVSKDKKSLNLTLGGLEDSLPAFVIHFDEEIEAYSLFGIRKQIDKLYVSVDENAMFQQALNQKILQG